MRKKRRFAQIVHEIEVIGFKNIYLYKVLTVSTVITLRNNQFSKKEKERRFIGQFKCLVIYSIHLFVDETGMRKSTSNFTSNMSGATCHAISATVAGYNSILS